MWAAQIVISKNTNLFQQADKRQEASSPLDSRANAAPAAFPFA